MRIAEGMKGIAEQIITSYEGRAKALQELEAETRQTLKKFAADHKRMAEEQSHQLANFAGDLAKTTRGQVQGFHKSHQQMSTGQGKALATFRNHLGKSTQELLDDFQNQRSEMSTKLRERLTKDVKDINTYVQAKIKEYDRLQGEVIKDLKATHDIWGKMTGVLAKARQEGCEAVNDAGETEGTSEEGKPKRTVRRASKRAKRGKGGKG